MTDSTPGTKRELLRHCVATLAYLGGKAVRGAPEEFGGFVAGRVGDEQAAPRREFD